MGKTKNFGTHTVRFNEGIIASGSANNNEALIVTGSATILGNLSNYVLVVDNDENSSGHVLKLSTDGNGSGTRILEMEDGDGDIIFRARADGRFGFGPDGVSSMGAGTFVVGIDNSSHTADIAISQRLQHLGDSNTYLDFPSNDTFNLVAGGNSFLKYDSGNILINNANANVDTKIMADNGSVVLHVDAGDNRVGIGTTSPLSELDVSGSIAITKAISTPSQPAVDQGYLYIKSDGKLYWRSSSITETDLTAGGGGTSKHFVTGHCDLTTGNKPTNWVNASSVSAANAIKTWFIVPYAATLDRIIVSVKSNNFNTSNDGNITLSVYKNQTDYGSTIVNQTIGADDFTEKVSNMAGGTTDCNQKIFSGLNQSLSEGDLIQVKVGKSTGSDKEALVTMVFEG